MFDSRFKSLLSCAHQLHLAVWFTDFLLAMLRILHKQNKGPKLVHDQLLRFADVEKQVVVGECRMLTESALRSAPRSG